MKVSNFNLKKDQIVNQLYFFLLSLVPLSIILGPAISLINILITVSIFALFSFNRKIFPFRRIEIILFFVLYFYLIFNSLISIDNSIGIYRNLGFIRFILYFIVINYFFYLSINNQKVLKFWLVILSIFIFDVYFERLSGSNILGFGKIEIDGVAQPNGDRVVSFFKDEPISGAFMSGFIFVLLGFVFSKFKENNFSKFLSFLILLIFLIGVLITGERSNTIKVFMGCFVFLFVIDFIKLKTKIMIMILFFGILSIIVYTSDYIKMRYVGQIYNQLAYKGEKSNFSDNLYIQLYKSGYAVFENNPIFGVGNKNYRVETCDNKKKDINPEYYCTTHPHQVYFELLSEHGVFGFVIILAIIFFLTFRILKKILLSKNYIQIGAFIYVLINFIPILPSGAFFSDFNLTLFMLNFSIMYAINKETNIFNENIKGR